MKKEICSSLVSHMVDPSQKISVHPETGRTVVETVNKQESMTQQQFKDECDINNIMKKYNQTGELTHLNRRKAMYGDFSEIRDYHEMLETVRYADEAFQLLPAELRARFANDPGKLLEFLQDEKNYDEGVKLGLLNERPIKTTPTKQNDSTKQNEGVKNEGQSTQQSQKNDSKNS